MHLGDAYCRHYGDTIEITMHVLRDCPITMMVWVHIVDVDIRKTLHFLICQITF